MDEQYKVLVVDDEAHIVHVVGLKLRNAGYEVLSAADGEEGYEMALEHLPDVIITDFQMPYMTGLEMCCKLRQHPETAGIPVLMLTARGFTLDDEDLRAANVIRALTKPFSPRELLSCVERALRKGAA